MGLTFPVGKDKSTPLKQASTSESMIVLSDVVNIVRIKAKHKEDIIIYKLWLFIMWIFKYCLQLLTLIFLFPNGKSSELQVHSFLLYSVVIKQSFRIRRLWFYHCCEIVYSNLPMEESGNKTIVCANYNYFWK